MIVLALPLTVLTFGFFLLAGNARSLWPTAAIVPGIGAAGIGASDLEHVAGKRGTKTIGEALE